MSRHKSHYAGWHNVCFSLYVAKKGKSLGTDKDSQYEAAFQELAEDIIPGIRKGKAYGRASLLTRFRETLDRRGIGSESYTKQQLKSRIEKHFGDDVVFPQPSHGSKPEIVYSSTIKVQDVLNVLADNYTSS